MLGFIDGLRRDGVDLGEADLVVGTSAGARTGAQLANAGLGEAVELYRRPDAPQIQLPAKLEDFVAAAARIIAEVGDGQEAARRIANLEPLGTRLVSAAERRPVLAAGLTVQTWPEQRLAIAAVDAETGGRVAFDADSGVDLLDALCASGALPGIVGPMTIDGRRYVDGGVHSLYNADLAAGHERVVVVSPLPQDDYLRAKLDAEVAALGDATVHVVLADEQSLAAIGSDPLSSANAPSALTAGAGQARRESAALKSAWNDA